jgi:hypothetical protein
VTVDDGALSNAFPWFWLSLRLPKMAPLRRRAVGKLTFPNVQRSASKRAVVLHQEWLCHGSSVNLPRSAQHHQEELQAPPKDRPLAGFSPYGMWTCADGSEVLFNRFYAPIAERAGPEALGPSAIGFFAHGHTPC